MNNRTKKILVIVMSIVSFGIIFQNFKPVVAAQGTMSRQQALDIASANLPYPDLEFVELRFESVDETRIMVADGERWHEQVKMTDVNRNRQQTIYTIKSENGQYRYRIEIDGETGEIIGVEQMMK